MTGKECDSRFLFLPMRKGGAGLTSAVHRIATTPWTTWRTVMPQLMENAEATDLNSMLNLCPKLSHQLTKLQQQFASQVTHFGYANKTLDAALRTEVTHKSLIQKYMNKI